MNLKSQVAYNFNCLIETEGLLKAEGHRQWVHLYTLVKFRKRCKTKMGCYYRRLIGSNLRLSKSDNSGEH